MGTLLDRLKKHITASGTTESVYHKLALIMAHPAHPEGLVKKRVVNQLETLSGLEDAELTATLKVDAPDMSSSAGVWKASIL